MFDREAVKYGCNDWNAPDPEPIVEDIIDHYDLASAQDTFEAYVSDITKVMTEEELKEILKRFLYKGESEKFIKTEIANIA